MCTAVPLQQACGALLEDQSFVSAAPLLCLTFPPQAPCAALRQRDGAALLAVCSGEDLCCCSLHDGCAVLLKK